MGERLYVCCGVPTQFSPFQLPNRAEKPATLQSPALAASSSDLRLSPFRYAARCALPSSDHSPLRCKAASFRGTPSRRRPRSHKPLSSDRRELAKFSASLLLCHDRGALLLLRLESECDMSRLRQERKPRILHAEAW